METFLNQLSQLQKNAIERLKELVPVETLTLWDEEQEEETGNSIFDMPNYPHYGKHGFLGMANVFAIENKSGEIILHSLLEEGGEAVTENANFIPTDIVLAIADMANGRDLQ